MEVIVGLDQRSEVQHEVIAIDVVKHDRVSTTGCLPPQFAGCGPPLPERLARGGLSTLQSKLPADLSKCTIELRKV